MSISQNDKVLQFMKMNGSISSMQAFKYLGVTRLSARIADLRERGVKIISKTVYTRSKDDTPIHYSVYSLVDNND